MRSVAVRRVGGGVGAAGFVCARAKNATEISATAQSDRETFTGIINRDCSCELD